MIDVPLRVLYREGRMIRWDADRETRVAKLTELLYEPLLACTLKFCFWFLVPLAILTDEWHHLDVSAVYLGTISRR